MIVNKNGLGYGDGELALKSGRVTPVAKETITLSKNGSASRTYPVNINGYVSMSTMGVKVQVSAYTTDAGNMILIPDNTKELVSTTSKIEQAWTIPEGQASGTLRVTMEFSPTTSNVTFTFKASGQINTNIQTSITLEDAVVYYQYESYDNIIEIDENSVKLYKDTTAYGTLTVGGDVSIGGSLTIPSNKSITIDKLESGSIVINSMTNGSVVISNKIGGTAQINGVIIKDSGDSQPTTITIPRGNKASSMVNGVWYYVPEQSITESSYTFTVPECVIKGGTKYDNFVYSVPNLTSASIKYALVVYNNKIQISKHTVAPHTDTTVYSDIVSYYTTDIKFA